MAPKFQGVDFYQVDGLLTEEERAVRDTVRSWVDDHVLPIIAEHYLEGRFPMQRFNRRLNSGRNNSAEINGVMADDVEDGGGSHVNNYQRTAVFYKCSHGPAETIRSNR